jgi:chromosome partitioning protein
MEVIAMASRKGGVGKTNTTENLGVELSRRGYKVMLLDTDDQGSLTQWWNDRKEEEPSLMQVEFQELPRALQLLESNGFDYVLIDTPPMANEVIRFVTRYADLVVIPCKAGSSDLKAITQTISIVKEAKKPYVFLLNEVMPNAKITKDVMIALSQHGKLCPIIPARTVYKEAGFSGLTPIDMRVSSPASLEFRRLADYILSEISTLQASA